MAPTSKTQRRQTDVGYSDDFGGREVQPREASCLKRRLWLRCRKKSLEVNVSLRGLSTNQNSNSFPGFAGSGAEEEFENRHVNSLESASDPVSADGLQKRSLSELLGEDGDGDDNQDRSDFGLSQPLPQLPPLSLPHPLPLPPLLSNPLAALVPNPKAEPSTPPVAPPVASSPPSPPPAAPPAQPPPPASISISIPPPASATDGISENLGAPTPSTTSPPGTSLSAPPPKSTSSGDDGDDGGDSGDEGGDDNDPPSSTSKPSTFSTSTRSILSLTAAIPPPYETQSTGRAGERSSISRTKDITTSFTTSVILPDQTARAKTTVEMTTMTIAPSPSETAVVVQGHKAAYTSRLSPASEKAVIATTSIGGFFILLALAWYLWCLAKRKSGGRKSVWPASFPSPDIFDGPRRVSSKVNDRFTSIKGRLLPGTLGWCNIDDSKHGDASENEKPAPRLAPKTGGLLERRLGAGTPPQRVTVNSYGMIFRAPVNGDSMSDILEPARLTPPPASAVAKQKSRKMAAAHLENARASVSVSSYNTRSQSLAPSRMNTRISDASSLSSGFGDGDIVIIHPPTAAATAIKSTQPSPSNSNINLNSVRTSPERKSFSSRFSRNNRDTVLTNSSEDLRPRFRTVSSWVHQQSRRTKRAAASRNEDGVPAVPENLPEQGFDMMMPDGEEPKRVESAMWRGR